MFKSFFPNPRLFFPLLLVWIIFSITIWYLFKDNLGALLNLNATEQAPVIGLGHFVTDSFLLLYAYYAVSVLIFAGFWMIFAPHRWQLWS
ncbi:MAG: hypothetical protein MI802_03930, partial [Desulfobacterales bacterium]|nr:hypothetical protein [Desulfobacterales bacterium]